MKFIALAALALIGVAAVNLDQKTTTSLAAAVNEPCEPALDVSEK